MDSLLETLDNARKELQMAKYESAEKPSDIQKKKMVMYWSSQVERLEALLS